MHRETLIALEFGGSRKPTAQFKLALHYFQFSTQLVCEMSRFHYGYEFVV